jgi:hypothetical protein
MRALDSGSAAVRVWLSASNEFLYAPTRLRLDIVPEMTGPGNQPSC